MANLEELISDYKTLVQQEKSLLKSMIDKKNAYEKDAKKDREILHKLRIAKNKLNQKCVDKKVISVVLGDLVKEISNITKINEKNIEIEAETDAVYMGYKKKSMNQMLKLINEDENSLDIRFNIFYRIDGEKMFNIYLRKKLNIFDKLNNGKELAKYFYLEKEKASDDCEGFNVFTTLCIDKKAYKNIVCNLGLEEFLANELEDKDYSNALLKKAVLKCIDKKEEKTK